MLNKKGGLMGTSWEDIKKEALNKLGWRRSVRFWVGLKPLGAALRC